MGIIDIRGDDLLISGSGGFTEYVSGEMKESCDVDIYEGDKATYICMKIAKVSDLDFGGG